MNLVLNMDSIPSMEIESTSIIKKIDPNLFIAVCVLISSFAALFVYIRQTNIMSEQTQILLEQTKVSSWPHLSIELWRGFNEKDIVTFKIIVANKGNGPAILEKTAISYDGNYAKSWNDFYRIIGVPDSIPTSHSNQNIHNRVISSKEDITLIDWSQSLNHDDQQARLIDYIYSKADKIKVEICYKSLHEDIWNVSRHGFRSDLETNERSVITSCDYNDSGIFLE